MGAFRRENGVFRTGNARGSDPPPPPPDKGLCINRVKDAFRGCGAVEPGAPRGARRFALEGAKQRCRTSHRNLWGNAAG